ncbi:MAG: glutamate synthase subunit beta [Bacteroidaceae bacterium]
MGNPKAFLTTHRLEAGYRPLNDRLSDFGEVEQTLNIKDRKLQASRCMDCGVPFCHWACPLGNKPPEWNDAIYKGDYDLAYKLLNATNNFPEFTGRICPAPCEQSCVLKLSCDEPITIREDEAAITERAYQEGYVKPHIPETRNGKTVAVIGAGPAGMAVADQLNQMGYEVTLFDKAEAVGGLLRFGIPNFKLNKNVIDRRVNVMVAEGIKLKMKTKVSLKKLPKGFDAYCMCTGAEIPRDLPIEGRELKGVHFALEMLSQQNRVLAGQTFKPSERITAKDKHVLVIGGGDTGSDCIGTSNRHGCKSVTQVEIMPKPPVGMNEKTPWPQWPIVLKTTSSHKEGCERKWCITTNKFIGENGRIVAAELEEIEWLPSVDGKRPEMRKTGKKETIPCDLVLLAMGFLKNPEESLPDNVFIAGDAIKGASLVVRAIAHGREVADKINEYLKK